MFQQQSSEELMGVVLSAQKVPAFFSIPYSEETLLEVETVERALSSNGHDRRIDFECDDESDEQIIMVYLYNASDVPESDR